MCKLIIGILGLLCEQNKLEFLTLVSFSTLVYIFVGKARSLTQSRAPERCFTWASLTSRY
jgi:hypothetical protein